MINTILLDIDNTLQKKENDTSTETLNLLKTLQKSNIRISFATARSRYMIYQILDRKKGIRLGVSVNNKFYANVKYHKELLSFLGGKGLLPLRDDNVNTSQVCSIWIRDVAEELFENLLVIAQKHNLRMTHSIQLDGLHSCFLTNKVSSKANALNDWFTYCNISKDQVLFIGDGINDVEIAKRVGVSSAVNNAAKELKDVVSYVSEYKYDRGVSDIIKKHVAI
ncbi:MAG: HAD family hydrolase [Candidatus Dojkabacteria bacterium]